MDTAGHKSAIRASARAARQAIDPGAREVAAAEVAARALALPELAHVAAVLGYAALPEELDPAPLVEALRARGARIALPRVCGQGALALHWVDAADLLVEGHAGILEPDEACDWAAPHEFDALLVPGVAFDHAGGRVGFGGGFYDSLLELVASHAVRIGLAFDEQIVENVPAEDHDEPVDIVVTPTRVLRRSDTRPI